MNPNSVARPTKTAAAPIHQRRGKRPGDRHHDHEREADEEELRSQQEPVREQRLDVASVGLVVAAVPPDLGETERHLRDPDQGEADHAQQHPRPDPACRRLTGEADAPAGVGDQDADEHELGDDELDPEEALVPLGAGDHVRVDGKLTSGQVEPARHAALPERIRSRRPGSREHDEAERAQRGRAVGQAAASGPGAGGRTARLGRPAPARRPPVRGGGRSRVRVLRSQQERVGVRLREIPDRSNARVAKPDRHPTRDERREPAEERDEEEQVREHECDQERGHCEHDPEEGQEAVLAYRRIDHDLQWIALADEAGERIRDHGQVGVDLRLVAHVGGAEAVQRLGQAAEHQRADPADERCDVEDVAPEVQPDQVRDGEQEPEEDGQPRAAAVVVELEPNGALGGRARDVLVRIARRVAIRQREEIGAGLRAVAERPDDQVAEAARHPALDERREPREEGRHRGEPAPAQGVAAEEGGDQQRRQDQHELEQRHEPPLWLGLRDLDPYGVTGVVPDEPRKRVRCEPEEGADVSGVTDVRGEEAVERPRRPRRDQHREPVEDCRRRARGRSRARARRSAGSRAGAGRRRSGASGGGRRRP